MGLSIWTNRERSGTRSERGGCEANARIPYLPLFPFPCAVFLFFVCDGVEHVFADHAGEAEEHDLYVGEFFAEFLLPGGVGEFHSDELANGFGEFADFFHEHDEFLAGVFGVEAAVDVHLPDVVLEGGEGVVFGEVFHRLILPAGLCVVAGHCLRLSRDRAPRGLSPSSPPYFSTLIGA